MPDENPTAGPIAENAQALTAALGALLSPAGDRPRDFAYEAYHALMHLQDELGEQAWLTAAIGSLDALRNNEHGIDELGRALDSDGKPYAWCDEVPTVRPPARSGDMKREVFVFAHQRDQPVSHEVLTCEVCGGEFVVTAWPGMNTPRFCSDDCRREHKAAYMREYRAKKKAQQG